MIDAYMVVDPSDSDKLDGPERGVPVVTVGRNRTASVPWVDVDHEAALSTLLDHLAEGAGDGPAWFVTLPRHLRFVDSLEHAFHGWVRSEGREGEVLRKPDDPHQVLDLVERRLAESGKPALIVTALDRQAVGVQSALASAGLGIPVGSASDGEVLGLIAPPISAMALDGAAHGRTAITMLLDWLRTGEPPQNRLLPARLRAR
jgi:DNA-binding LacI/PurR family transcriptional regulator